MNTRKGWRDRLAGYPNLPNGKANPPAMRGTRYLAEDFARKLAGTR